MGAPRVRADIVAQHLEDAAQLYARYARSCVLLDGNRAQTRSLLARVDAHVDALATFYDAVSWPWGAAKPLPGERFVAVAAALGAGRPLPDAALATLDARGTRAVRDAMMRYARADHVAVVDAWLAEGSDAQRTVALELLAAWRDPRAATIADRAVRRGAGAVRAAGACALASLGVATKPGVLDALLRECADAPPWCDALLDGALRVARDEALAAARGCAAGEGRPCDMAWVIVGLSGDAALLRESDALHGARGALPAARALAGDHAALDARWDESAALPVSNALREAAYVVLGGEAPPVVVRDDMPEEPEDRAQRATEDAALRALLRTRDGGAWRWGCDVSEGALRGVAGELGPRPRRWAQAALALMGEATEAWDDVALSVAQ